MTCEKCGGEIVVGSWPFCRDGHAPGVANVIGDEIDVTQEHFSDHPERFRSRQRMKERARELGIVPAARHVGAPGSDKSKHTVKWV